MNVALYARSATNNQESIEKQLASLRTLCELENCTVVGEYADNAVSGNSIVAERLAMSKLLEDCKSKQIEAICAFDTCRIARSFVEFMRFQSVAKTHDIELISEWDEHCMDEVKKKLK